MMAADMEHNILDLLDRRDYVPANVPRLLQQLGLAPNQQQELQRYLGSLEKSGQIIRTKGNRYIKSSEADLVSGIIHINRRGKGFLQADEPGRPEVMIPESSTSTALNGDRVLVRLEVRPAGLRGPDGELSGAVVRILERKRSHIVGTLQRSRRFLYVIPDDPRLPHDIYVPEPQDVGRPANAGDKVVVELREWASRHTNPEGDVIEVLGPADAEGVDMLSVLRQYDLPLHFPGPVLQEAKALAKVRPLGEPSPDEIVGRLDCRADMVVTIDPDDAKDFDDALCLQRVARQEWKLWVHIADVSHYVKPGTALDEEACQRGNSTYLVDRVIPMLPEALSNELCSLNPGTDRLTRCAEFRLSREGAVLETKFHTAVIRSKRRFTYKEALAILQRRPADDIERMLHQAHELAQRLRRTRFQAGALDLDFPETRIRLDGQGRILRIEQTENDISHQLIEEFMLLANEAVATRLKGLRRPTIYRVHEPPDEKRLAELREQILSHNIPCGNLRQRPQVQKLLQSLNPLPIGPALKIAFLKSLKRARYGTQPLGHYGLNKNNYTHFTSPIRRYADLLVHRSLFDKSQPPVGAIQKISDHISETERNSDDAERDSKQVKLFAFLKAQLASTDCPSYPALVVDLRNFGFFVDVPDLGLGGLVHLSSLEDDFYVFDPTRCQLRGRRGGRVIKLGDRVLVQVAKVDSFKKQVDFRLVKTGQQKVLSRPLKSRYLKEHRLHGMRE
jgi:ribonuclease R